MEIPAKLSNCQPSRNQLASLEHRRYSMSVLYFVSARFLVCLSALTEIASEMGGRVMVTRAVGFSSTGCLEGKGFSFSVRGH